MPTRPIVGISSYDAHATWGVWDTRATLVPAAYLEAFLAAGADPVVLPIGVEVEQVLDRLDGLILIGGPDIESARYGEDPHALAQPPSAHRDQFELELAAVATRKGLPMLAICRGLQVLNVLRGGTLQQHLPDLVGHEGHSPGPGLYGRTTVRIDPDTRLASILGATSAVVDCYHHQAINQLGAGLRAAAYAEDGTIEAAEDPDAFFVVGVQWHPEEGGDPALLRAFVAACLAHAEKKGSP